MQIDAMPTVNINDVDVTEKGHCLGTASYIARKKYCMVSMGWLRNVSSWDSTVRANVSAGSEILWNVALLLQL